MNSYKSVFQLIVISSSEDEEKILERASMPLPREQIPHYRVILEISHFLAEAVADEERYFNTIADSLESDCKRMRLNTSLDSLEPEVYIQQEDTVRSQDEELPDSPEIPDKSMNSEVFIVEEPITHEESVTSSKVAEYPEQVHQEDSNSYFITPPDPLRRINFLPTSPLNDLEGGRSNAGSSVSSVLVPQLSLLPCQPGRGVRPTSGALSHPAPGVTAEE